MSIDIVFYQQKKNEHAIIIIHFKLNMYTNKNNIL